MKYPKQESDKKNPDEGKDLVIGHESQVYPPYRIYFIRRWELPLFYYEFL